MTNYTDIGVEKHGHVGLIEIRKPPLNFFDVSLINQIADALEEFDRDIEIRASVLAAQGKAFCAGANFGDPARQEAGSAPRPIRRRTCRSTISTSRRCASSATRSRSSRPSMAPPSAAGWACGVGGFPRHLPRGALRRQFHQARLPSRLRPDRDAARTGRQEQCGTDFLHQPARHRRGSHPDGPRQHLRAAGPGAHRGHETRAEIAECSPLGLVSTRATMRAGLADRVLAATNHELVEQNKLRATEDFKEGVKATAERRVANFRGR